MKVGQFAIFDGEVGIINGIDVPLDKDGRPVRTNATFVPAQTQETAKPVGEIAYLSVEFHPINEDGTTKNRVVEDDRGNPLRVETDIKYLVGGAINGLELLEPTDERIPENRRAK